MSTVKTLLVQEAPDACECGNCELWNLQLTGEQAHHLLGLEIGQLVRVPAVCGKCGKAVSMKCRIGRAPLITEP